MNRDKILEICEFRKITELICKQCGTVSTPAEVRLSFSGNKCGAYCPGCNSYIKWLPTAKSWRIFLNAKIGMIDIEKVDTGRLQWHLRNVKISEDLQNAIEKLIERRTTDPASFIAPPPDIDTKKEIELMDRERYLVEQKAAKQAEQKRMIKSIDDGGDYMTIQRKIAQIEGIGKTVNDLERQILRTREKLRQLGAG